MRSVVLSYVVALAFWFAMFSPWTAERVNFWAMMTLATGVLASLALVLGRPGWRRKLRFRPIWIVTGIASALLLYGVFWLGHTISTALFDFPASEVARVYALKTGASAAVIGPLLVLWIAPGEELFWRGFLQQKLATRYGRWPGLIAGALMYAAVHLWAFNLTLLVAALICGMFWGWMMLRYESVWPSIISHAVWDVVIFVLLPIR